MGNQAVVVSHLSFGYDARHPVLSDVSLEVEIGEWIGLIGPNGGGKTTLLRLLMGLLTPSSGEIQIFDHSCREAQQLLAYVPQKLPFDRRFPISVMDVVLTGRLAHLPWYGRYRSTDRKLAQEALERVGMGEMGERTFGDLSGGQEQRVLIARALASKPRLLLLDEPTNNLDLKTQHAIYALLEELNRDLTIIMVSHDLSTIINRVDRLYCLNQNCVAMEPHEVCNHFALGLYHVERGEKSGQ